MWQMEKSLDGVKPLIEGWQMLIAKCVWWNSHIVRWQMLFFFFLKLLLSKKHGIQVYFRGGKTIKDLLVAPKDKTHITKRVASYTGTSVTGWNVMRSI